MFDVVKIFGGGRSLGRWRQS